MIEVVTRAIKHHAKHEGNWTIRRGGGWWYAFKAILCYALRREQTGRWGEYGDEYICVAAWGGRQHYMPGEPTTHSWDELQVGRGVFRGWRFAIENVWSG